MDSTACEGVTVQTVIGPPGTGKTQYVARQVALAVEAGETPTVVSLTRTAAKEAAGRVPLSRDRVSTLHSQAYPGLGKTGDSRHPPGTSGGGTRPTPVSGSA